MTLNDSNISPENSGAQDEKVPNILRSYNNPSPVESLTYSVMYEINNLLSDEDKLKLESFMTALNDFNSEISKRSLMVGYGYNLEDYDDRLIARQRIFKNTMWGKVLTADVKQAYDRLTASLKALDSKKQESYSNVIKGLLTDITYESMSSKDLIIDASAQIEGTKFREYEKEMYEVKNNKLRLINIHSPVFQDKDFNRLLKYIKGLRLTQAKVLRLEGCINELSVPNLLDIIRVAGRGGIKSLSLSWNHLGREMDSKSIIKLIKIAGMTGIRKLDLSFNKLQNVFEADNLEDVFIAMYESGIRSAKLRGNGYEKADEILFISELAQKYNINIKL